MGGFRIEKDSMGEVRVPEEAYYGAQTRRAFENFPVSGAPMPLPVVHAVAMIKGLAAEVNAGLGIIPPPLADAISIRERPASVEDRAVPGHWEGDLLTGTIDTQVGTLVERQSRYVMLVRLPTKAAPQVAAGLARQIRTLPVALRRSLTWDRGRELAAHRQFTVATNVQVYFCDPHSPWQRGSNENTNGLLRQYLPRGADLSRYSQGALNRIARELNERPRKTLGFQTPAAILAQLVASTG